jgi:hypothetical protein
MGDTVKTCTGCCQAKSQAFFHLKGSDKSGAARLQSTCKDCANKNRVLRYQKKQSRKKRLAKTINKFDLQACGIKIIYPACADSSQKMLDTMADYIEAIYAISLPGTGKQ